MPTMKQWWKTRKQRKREKKNFNAYEEVVRNCNKFYDKTDMKEALFRLIMQSCTEEEMVNLSNKFGRAAHEKGRNKIRRGYD